MGRYCDEPSENENIYPRNVLSDMGYTKEELDRYGSDLIRNLEALRSAGLFKPARYRIFKYHYIDGYGTDMIAGLTASSENHVKRELSKVRHLLRKNMIKLLPRITPMKSWEYEIVIPCELEPEYCDIEELDLSVRAFNGLKRAGMKTVGDVIEGGREKLLKIRNLGDKSRDEITGKIKMKFGIQL